MRDTIVILGACGGAREVYWFLEDTYPGTDVVFVDDLTDVTEATVGDRVFPVVKDWDFSQVRRQAGSKDAFEQFFVGLGHPPDKKVMVEKALAHGLEPAPTLVHPRALVHADCVLGRGGMVMPGSHCTTCVTLGDYVFLQNTTVGHYATIGDYVSCYPGSAVSGECKLGEGVLLGTGAVVRDEVRIAPWVVVGAQSCVVKDIEEPHITVAGVPARKLY